MSRAGIGTIRINLLADIGGLTSGIRKATTELERWSRKTSAQLDGVGRSLTRNLTAPLTAVAGASLFAAGNFERSMNRVQVLSGATERELADLTKVAKDLGASTQFSASQAAEGMGFLAMAGLDVQQVLGALPDTLNLAAAAQMDLARSADLVTNIMSGFQIETSDLGHAVDVLTKAFVSSNTDLAQLGEAFKIAGPVAKGAGLDFEETAAALALMASSGFQASLGGTALRGTISRLLGSLEDSNPILERLGVNIKGADGGLRSLHQIVRDLERSGASAADMMALFGERAGPAMIALVGQGSDALAEMTEKLRDSGGTAERVATVQMRGLFGAFTKMKSATEGLLISIGEAGLLDAATKIVEVATKLVAKLDAASPRTKALAVGIGGVAIALGPALIGLGLLVKSIGLIVAGAGAAVTALTGLTVAVAAVGVAAAGLEFGRWLFDEFKVVQELSADFVAVASRTWEGIKGIFTMGLPMLKVFILTQLRDMIAEIQEFVSSTIDNTLIAGLPPGLKAAATGLKSVATSSAPDMVGTLDRSIKKTSEKLASEAVKMEAAMDNITAVHAQTLKDIDKEFGGKDRKGRSFTDFVAEDIVVLQEKLRGMAQSLRDSLEPSSEATEETRKKVDQLATSLENLAEKGEDAGKKVEDASDSFKNRLIDGVEGWSRTVSQAFTDMVFDGERSFRRLADSFGRMLLQMAVQELVFAPLFAGIRGAITPTPSAKGNVFAGGSLVPFAKGGVVSGPSTFPMRGGRTGLMGEAGPEAIMPLTRTPGGDLGVRSAGGVSVTIVDQRSSGARPEVSEATDGSGRRQLTIMLRDEVRAMMGDGSLDRTMRANYGVGRQGVTR